MLENPQENACGSVFIETLQTQILKFHYNLSKRENPVEMLSFEIWKFLRASFLQNTFEQLLLEEHWIYNKQWK